MKLTTAEYKAVAKDALKGNWKKAVLAMLLAACLGAFFTSVFFIGRFMAIMGISIHLFEGLPHFFTILLVTGSLLAVFFFFAVSPVFCSCISQTFLFFPVYSLYIFSSVKCFIWIKVIIYHYSIFIYLNPRSPEKRTAAAP